MLPMLNKTDLECKLLNTDSGKMLSVLEKQTNLKLHLVSREQVFFPLTEINLKWAGLTEHSKVGAGSSWSNHKYVSTLIFKFTVLDFKDSFLAIGDYLVFLSGLELHVILHPFDFIGLLGYGARERCLLSFHHF